MRTFVSYQSTKRVKKRSNKALTAQPIGRSGAHEVYQILNRLGIGEFDALNERSEAKIPSGWAQRDELTVLWSGNSIEPTTENPAQVVLQELLAMLSEEPLSLESCIRLWVYDHPGDYVLAVMSMAHPQKVIVAGRGRELSIGRKGSKVLVGSDRSQAMNSAPMRLRIESCQVAVVDRGGALYLDEAESGKVDPLVREIRWNRKQLEDGLRPTVSSIAARPTVENVSNDLIVIDSGRGELRVWWKQSQSDQGPICIWKCLSA